MSKRIKGITIEIDGETKGLDKALGNVNKESGKLQKELKDVEKLLKFNPGNTELLAQKQKLLSDQVNNTREKLDTLRDAQEDVTRAFENGDIGEEQYRAFQREIVETESKLKHFEGQLDKSKSKLDEIGEGFQKSGEKVKAAGDKMTSAGKGLTAGVTTPILGMGAASIAAFKDVEESFEIVITKTGATGDALDALEGNFKNLAGRVPADLSTVGEAIGEVNTQFGFTGERLEDASERMIQFSKINGQDVTSASIQAKQAIEAYGLSGEDLELVLDGVTKAAQDTGQSTDKIFELARKGAPQIKSLGLDFSEGAQLIGRFEKSGIDSSAALSSLTKAQVNFAKEGKTLNEGLAETEAAILGAKTETEALAIASEIFGAKQAPAMVEAIQRGTLSLEDLQGASENAAGSVETTFNNTLDPAEKMQIAMNNAKIALADVGSTILVALEPAINRVIEIIQRLAQWFMNLSPAMKNMVLLFAAIAAAIGPLLIVVGTVVSAIGNILIVVGKVLPMLGKLRTAFTVIRTVMLALTGPIGIAIAVITALGILIYKNWDTIKAKTLEVFGFLKTWIPQTFASVKAAVVGVAQSIATGVVQRFNAIRSGISNAIQTAVNVAITVFNVMRNAVMAVALAIANGVIQRFNAIRAGVSAAVTAVSNVVRVIFNALRAYITTVVSIYRTIFTAGFNAIRSVVSSIANGIRSTAVAAFNGLRSGISAAVNGVRSVVSSVFGAVRSLTSSLLNGARSAGVSAFNSLRSGVSSAVNGVRSVVSSVFSGIRNLITSPIESAKNTVLRIIDTIKGAFSRMNITIPKPKLPRISVSTGSKEVAGISIPFPKFSVDWYKKGGVFGNASIIGVGEEPGVSEAVIPLKPSVLAQIGRGIADSMGGGMNGSVELVVNLDGYEIARAVQPYNDANQQSRTNMKSYMRGNKS